MAYLACDKDGTEAIYYRKPFRSQQELWLPDIRELDMQIYINLPSGTIAKLIGRELTWSDEPYELK